MTQITESEVVAELVHYGLTPLWYARNAHDLERRRAVLEARIQRGAVAGQQGLTRIPTLVRDHPNSYRLDDSILDFLDEMVAKPDALYTVEKLTVWDQLREWQADREGALMEKPCIDNLGVVRYPLTGFGVPEEAILPIRGLVRVRPGGIWGSNAVHQVYGLVPMGLQTILQTEKSQQVSDKKLHALTGGIAFVRIEMDIMAVDPESIKPRDPWHGRLRRQRRYPIPEAEPKYTHMRTPYGNFVETDDTSFFPY